MQPSAIRARRRARAPAPAFRPSWVRAPAPAFRPSWVRAPPPRIPRKPRHRLVRWTTWRPCRRAAARFQTWRGHCPATMVRDPCRWARSTMRPTRTASTSCSNSAGRSASATRTGWTPRTRPRALASGRLAVRSTSAKGSSTTGRCRSETALMSCCMSRAWARAGPRPPTATPPTMSCAGRATGADPPTRPRPDRRPASGSSTTSPTDSPRDAMPSGPSGKRPAGRGSTWR